MNAAMFKAGIIGVGRIGALLEQDPLREKPATHIAAYHKHPEIKVEAIADINTALLNDVKKRWNIPKSYSDYKQMLYENRLDIISVATPIATHYSIVMDILDSPNIPKIIFCEKPIAENIEQAAEMVNACRKKQVKLAINHTRRWSPIWRSVVQTVQERKIGAPLFSIGYYSGDPLNDGIHMADLFNWMRLDPNAINIKGNYLIFEMDILGDSGRISVKENGRRVEFFVSKPSKHYAAYYELSQENLKLPQLRATPIELAVHDLVKCLKDPKKEPECTGEDGLAALSIVLRWMNDV